MFQNITEEVQEEEKTRTNIKVIRILKELLSFQNILIYVMTFFMSTLSIKQGIIPFGLAMVAACIGSSIPIICVYIAALIGTFVGNGLSALANFIAVSVMYFVLVLIFKSKIAVDERNELIKTGGKLFWACMIVEIVKNIKGVFLMYDFLIGVISAALVYVFYKIFVNGIILIKEFRIKEAFTIEELIAGTIMIAITSLAFNTLSIWNINISNIIIIFMIMVLGWKNGMLVGATCGVATGLAISFSVDTSFIEILMFAVSGIFSGLLNRFGKIGVIIGFILGNVLLTYTTNGNALVISYFREIFLASIGLLFVPSNIKISIKDLVGDKKLLSDIGETRLNGAKNEEISEKLKTVTDMFYEMMNSKEKNNIEFEEEFINVFLDNIEEIDDNIFYEVICNEENGIVLDIYKCIEENEIIVDKDLIKILTDHNNYIFMQDETIKNDLQEMIKIANRSYKMVQISIAKEQERNKNLKNMASNLKEASKIIDECAKKVVDDSVSKYAEKEKEIVLLLKSKNIELKSCTVKRIKNEKYIVSLEADNNQVKLKEKDVTINIADIISKSLGTKIIYQREKNLNDDKFLQVYASEDKYILQVGSSRLSKDNENISGDSNLQMRLDDGKYLLSIADGMGSGKDARESSKFAINMIKKLMVPGFEKEETIKLINNSLNLKSDKETYSSLDITVLDLYTGHAEIIKNGACNTYIKNKKNIKIISSDSIPVGIAENAELKSTTYEVSEGDILVMCSDGVLESKDEMKKDWIEEFLKNVSTNNVQKLADLILAEAVDNSYGIAKDDMTVIVCKIVKKK